jgi:hypothetical protein
MAFFCSNVSFVNGAVDQVGHTCSVTLTSHYAGQGFGCHTLCSHQFGIGSLSDGTGNQDINSIASDFSNVLTLVADAGYQWRGVAADRDGCVGFATAFAGTGGNKSGAVTATASLPTSSAVTPTTATISDTFFANTRDSTATVKMQYRLQGSGTWLDAPGGTSSYSGYASQSISRNLAGLTAGATYEFRMDMTRDTANDTSLDSATATFTAGSGATLVLQL